MAQSILAVGRCAYGSKYLRSMRIVSPEIMALRVSEQSTYFVGCSDATSSVLPGTELRAKRERLMSARLNRPHRSGPSIASMPAMKVLLPPPGGPNNHIAISCDTSRLNP